MRTTLTAVLVLASLAGCQPQASIDAKGGTSSASLYQGEWSIAVTPGSDPTTRTIPAQAATQATDPAPGPADEPVLIQFIPAQEKVHASPSGPDPSARPVPNRTDGPRPAGPTGP